MIQRINIDFSQSVIILTLFLFIAVSGDSNWLQDCNQCHCNWNSGKKTADCKNKSLTKIPNFISTELQVIDFSYNFIPEIRKDEFVDANLSNLHKLYMKNCTLQELNRDSLKGLVLLIELDLSNNDIRILHVGTFSGLVKLRNLIMNNNQIETLENNLFKDLLYLHRIEFKHNHIKTIGNNAFVNLPQLTIIYLDYNYLTILKKETFENMPKLKDLSLAQNPWNCTCELQPFREFTLNRNLYTPPTDCHEPSNLNGKLWSEIPMEDFACRPEILYPKNNVRYSTTPYSTGTTNKTGYKLEAVDVNITLLCRIRSSPKPTISWTHNKRPINLNDQRIQIRNVVEPNRNNIHDIYVSDLTIYGVRNSDKGTYICMAENRGGKDETDIQLAVNIEDFANNAVADTESNSLLIYIIVGVSILVILIIAVCILCFYYQHRICNYTKNSTICDNNLISMKKDKFQNNGSMLEGSVIIEMQKSLLTEVNPVEKPPRRTDIETTETDDGHEIKKTLLDEVQFGSQDDETNSVALSDTTPRSRQTFVEDGYGTNLPPDLLAFPAHVPHSPSLLSSISNIPDPRLYGKSHLNSPVHQHFKPNNNTIYGTTPQPGFRTLQHPKARNLTLANNRNNSPFAPAPIIYPPVVMKQGYMTIPRKPRVPSWTPSVNTEFATSLPITNPTNSETLSGNEFNEPVYDNLGVRTTASGNSESNINKVVNNQPVRYTMKDRPLPATPLTTIGNSETLPRSITMDRGESNDVLKSPSSLHSTKIYEPINELSHSSITSVTEPLYDTAKNKENISTSTMNSNGVLSKVPPRPPPKPKKRIHLTTNSQGGGSTSKLFEDEGEDGTEV